MTSDDELTDFELDVARVLRSLEPGDVASYGEVAVESGHPGAARAVGRFLRDHDGYPWWRIVNRHGRLVPGLEADQRRRLQAEGVDIVDGRVPMR